MILSELLLLKPSFSEGIFTVEPSCFVIIISLGILKDSKREVASLNVWPLTLTSFINVFGINLSLYFEFPTMKAVIKKAITKTKYR